MIGNGHLYRLGPPRLRGLEAGCASSAVDVSFANATENPSGSSVLIAARARTARSRDAGYKAEAGGIGMRLVVESCVCS